ncbi:hybrid cluster protein [Basidiobolus meristosporus CBS 931.73]|uniref:Hybrid cluster protein n=1 Tax=Basidiobolus meristosporus CBS 931.73 TaxID=1314790 RepID=A0A1Y1Z7X0_9FUNG|nr:hybrid cluster protein [Basidiobolus meristosporus CBS 931.73]|eukprot:ORY06097.1 hybrid cluster protein [Basidiobolus meristosporus CBS 931.73]
MLSEKPRMLILYGTQTGTTESYAKIVQTFAKIRSFDVRLARMDEVAHESLPTEPLIVFLSSTFYNGEFPDSAASLWSYLKRQDHSPNLFRHTRYAVFGLGNRTLQENFNKAAKLLDQRMSELGGFNIMPVGMGDEYDPNGHETAFRPWLKAFWTKLTGSDVKMTLPVSVQIQQSNRTVPEVNHEGYIKVPVVSNKRLTSPDYERTGCMVTFDISQTNQEYQVAGHVQVFPENPDELVVRAARRLDVDLDMVVEIQPMDDSVALPTIVTIRQLLKNYLDISSIPSRALVEGFSCLASDINEQEALESLASDMLAGNMYMKLSTSTVFSVVDVLERYPSVKISLEQFISNIPKISSRYYSIASSPLVSKDKIDIVFFVEEWATETGGRFQGLTSTYLSKKSPDVADPYVFLKIHAGLVHLPERLDTPILGVALGSGIGVFRSILQHREVLLEQGHEMTRIRLYYGMRYYEHEYLFKDELDNFTRKGLVEVIDAASRDHKKNCAVRMLDFPEKVTDYLDNNGMYLYCGLGGLIPGAMEITIGECLQANKQVSYEESLEIIANLRKQNRWEVEAYAKSVDEENALKSIILKRGGQAQGQEVPTATLYEDAKMFCYQCEQTYQGRGCTTIGVCGKTPEVAALQDLLITCLKRLSWYAYNLRQLQNEHSDKVEVSEVEFPEVNHYSLKATFSTLTNVNFDSNRFLQFHQDCRDYTKRLSVQYQAICKRLNIRPKKCPIPESISEVLDNAPGAVGDIEDMLVSKGKEVGILSRMRATKNDALVGLQEMIVYGLKGLSAYADHALVLAHEDRRIYEFLHKAFYFLTTKDSKDMDKTLACLMELGQVNLICMDVLHNANKTFGAQSPHTVSLKPRPGKCILVSGHDFMFLDSLLRQTEGLGINIYTHGEMLPAHGYPKLRQYKHLAGHYGVAWQRQSVEFPHFPGAIVMTTNCLTPPKDDYQGRLFTVGVVGWPNIPHVGDDLDYSAVIKVALDSPGFNEDTPEFEYPPSSFTPITDSYQVGFSSEAVLNVAPTVLKALETGDISRVFVIGGCDGYEGERSYYTDLAKMLPESAVVLTSGCGKFRINSLEWKTIGDSGIPRLLDMGQCNDAYSAIQIASALAEALNCTIHDLPLSIVLSWFEQKAVVVLLSLLSLGIQNIRVGPQLPAFLRPSAVKILSDKFGLKLIGDPKLDLEDMYGGMVASAV